MNCAPAAVAIGPRRTLTGRVSDFAGRPVQRASSFAAWASSVRRIGTAASVLLLTLLALGFATPETLRPMAAPQTATTRFDGGSARATTMRATAVALTHAQRALTGRCCNDADCVVSTCTDPCSGLCPCVLLHASPLQPVRADGLDSDTGTRGDHASPREDLVPLMVSREPALRPPIA